MHVIVFKKLLSEKPAVNDTWMRTNRCFTLKPIDIPEFFLKNNYKKYIEPFLFRYWIIRVFLSFINN